MERSINPLFNVHERYNDMHIINPYRHKQLLRGLIAHWKLDDNAASSTVVDSVGGYNGKLIHADKGTVTEWNTSTASISGKIGNGFTFKTSGTFDFRKNVQINDNDIFSFGNGSTDMPFSVSFWVYMNTWGYGSTSKYTFLVSKRDGTSGANNVEWNIFTFKDTTPRISVAIYDNTNANYLVLRKYLTDGFLSNWHHVLCTYDGSGNYSGLKVYIDGQYQTPEYEAEVGTYTAMGNKSCKLLICGNRIEPAENGLGLDGIIDEVSIWRNRELGAEDVELLYNEGSGRALENW